VVVCGSQGVLVHPGAYRLSIDALEKSPTQINTLLKSIVARQQARRPDVRYRPEVRFLVEGGGQAAYDRARRQLMFSELSGWPVALQIVEGDLHPTSGGLLR
jgi:hypothetical protein